VPQVEIKGRVIQVEKGTPLDVVLYANGQRTLYRSLKYGRPRGIQDDSTPYANSKRVRIRGYGVVDPLLFSVHKDVHVELDGKVTLGSRVSSLFNPLFKAGFQNSRIMRNPFLWKYLSRVVRSSGNLMSPEDGVGPSRGIRQLKTEVLVVGSGLSGLGVSEIISKAGKTCTMIDSHEVAGGSVRYADVNAWTGEVYPLLVNRLFKSLSNSIQYLRGIFLGVYEEKIGLVLTEQELIAIEFSSLVLATGSRYRLPIFEGNDIPGIVSLDYALRLRHYNSLHGNLGLLFEDERRKDIYSLFKGTSVANGDIRKVSMKGGSLFVQLTSGNDVRVDTLIFATMRQPSLELPAQLGVEYTYSARTGRMTAKVAENGSTHLDWLWVAGSVTGLYGLKTSYEHGVCVGNELLGKRGDPPEPDSIISAMARPKRGYVCFCEDVQVEDLIKSKDMGFSQPEKAKRYTGWGTGPCQGKLCLVNGLSILCDSECLPYTQRLPVYPLPFSFFEG
jgi:sarcosine oxidase subunit alpha